jgi:hypothetical protein
MMDHIALKIVDGQRGQNKRPIAEIHCVTRKISGNRVVACDK